jgi:hypothetical protein
MICCHCVAAQLHAAACIMSATALRDPKQICATYYEPLRLGQAAGLPAMRWGGATASTACRTRQMVPAPSERLTSGSKNLTWLLKQPLSLLHKDVGEKQVSRNGSRTSTPVALAKI